MGLFGADKPPMILSDSIELSIAKKAEPVKDTLKKDTIKIK